MIGDYLIPTGPDYGPFPHGCYGAIVHDLECPINTNVRAMTGPGSYPAQTGVSPHTISGLKEIAQLLDEHHAGAHVGGPGNQMFVGFEVTGYAAWTPAQWMADIHNLLNQARAVARLWKVMGWAASDLRWGSIAELQDARRRYDAGRPPAAPRLWTHNDVSQSGVSKTNHWDPGKGFPFAEFIKWCLQYLTGSGTPSANPTPQTIGTAAGAQPEDDNMAVYFTYSEVTPRPDGTYGSRVFVSDGVFFRHVKDMEELAHEVWRLRGLGYTQKYVTDGKFQTTDIGASVAPADAAQAIASQKWAQDPHTYGRDFAELLPKA